MLHRWFLLSTTPLLPYFTFTYISLLLFVCIIYADLIYILFPFALNIKRFNLYITFPIHKLFYLLHLLTMLSVLLSEMHHIQLYILFYSSKLLLINLILLKNPHHSPTLQYHLAHTLFLVLDVLYVVQVSLALII
jgi:hypothetical protein